MSRQVYFFRKFEYKSTFCMPTKNKYDIIK